MTPDVLDLVPFCPRFQRAVELIGARWTGVVLRALLSGKQRYSDIRRAVPHLSDRMLSQRLRELEAEGIVERVVRPETPVRVEYHLTDKGQALESAITNVAEWADRWIRLDDEDESGTSFPNKAGVGLDASGNP